VHKKVRNVYIVFPLPHSDKYTAFSNECYYFEVLLSAICKEFLSQKNNKQLPCCGLKHFIILWHEIPVVKERQLYSVRIASIDSSSNICKVGSRVSGELKHVLRDC